VPSVREWLLEISFCHKKKLKISVQNKDSRIYRITTRIEGFHLIAYKAKDFQQLFLRDLLDFGNSGFPCLSWMFLCVSAPPRSLREKVLAVSPCLRAPLCLRENGCEFPVSTHTKRRGAEKKWKS
jgi:hypothetical protein